MMMTKSAVIVGLGIALGAVGVTVFMAGNKKSSKPIVTVTSAVPTPARELATWTDQAGFTFQYPKELSVNKHDEDTDNYAHVELTNAEHPGSIIVWAKDSQWSDVESWIKSDKRFANATIADTVLGGQPGKKLLIAGPQQERIASTISDKILFTIEGKLIDSVYWSGVDEAIISSFVFASSSTTKSATNASKDSSENALSPSDDLGGDGGPVDEQEVLQ